MDQFSSFMNSMVGRAARVVVGIALVVLGLAMLKGSAGIVLAVIGLLPIAMGLSGHCLIELFGAKQRVA